MNPVTFSIRPTPNTWPIRSSSLSLSAPRSVILPRLQSNLPDFPQPEHSSKSSQPPNPLKHFPKDGRAFNRGPVLGSECALAVRGVKYTGTWWKVSLKTSAQNIWWLLFWRGTLLTLWELSKKSYIQSIGEHVLNRSQGHTLKWWIPNWNHQGGSDPYCGETQGGRSVSHRKQVL